MYGPLLLAVNKTEFGKMRFREDVAVDNLKLERKSLLKST